MLLYLGIFLIAVAIYYNTRDGNETNIIPLAIYLGGLGLFVACADMLGGYDRYIYGEVFDQYSMMVRVGGDVTQSACYSLFGTEWAFLAFNHLMSYVTMNRYIFIFTLTIIIYTLLFISIKRYCDDYPFAVILFLGLWFFFTFTYLRQVTAATIGWLAIQYAIDRKPIPFFAILLLAYGFHNSAIVLAPLYFVPQRIFPKNTVVVVLIVCLVMGILGVLGSVVAESDAFADKGKIAENAQAITEGGFRLAYLLEAVFFATFILMNYDMFEDEDPRRVTLMNMALIFCAMLLVFVRSDNGGRFAWHYMIGTIATISYIAASSDRVFYRHVIIVLCLFLFMRIFFAWQVYNNLYPYKSFFTDGHRTPDYTYEHYEYDYRYDVDKFYK